MSQAQVSVSADDWFSIKEKLKSEALTTKIIIGLREDGTKRKMNVSFVLLMAMCNIPGGSFEEQDFTDLNMEKLSPDEQRTLAEAWFGMDKERWMEAQHTVYGRLNELVPGKFDIKRRVSSEEPHCGSLLFQLLSHTFEVEMADSAPEIQRQFNEVVNFKGLTIKDLDVHVEKVMKVLRKMERNPDAALSETLKKQTILNGFSAPNKVPHQHLQHLGTILHDQVKDPNFGIERIFSRVREELTKYNPESKLEDHTRTIPITSGLSANMTYESSSPDKLVARIKDVLSDYPGYSATEVLSLFDRKHRLLAQSGSALLTCESEEDVGQKFRSNFQNRQGQGKQRQFVMQERQVRAKDALFKQNQQLKQQIKKLEKEKAQTVPNQQNQPPQKKMKVDDRAQIAVDVHDEWGVVYNPEHEAHARMAEVVTEECDEGDVSLDLPNSSTSEAKTTNMEDCEHSKIVPEFSQDDEHDEARDSATSSKDETETSHEEEEKEGEIHCETQDECFHQETSEAQESFGHDEFNESTGTSYFFENEEGDV